MKVTFLQASDGTRLSKKYSLKHYAGTPAPSFNAQPYPFVRNFNSFTFQFDTLAELFQLLVEQGQLGAAMLVGNLIRSITDEPRAGLTDPAEPVYILCADIDGLPGLTLKETLSSLPIAKVSVIVQYSPSSQLPGKDGLRVHLFAIIKPGVSPDLLRRWLMHVNFTNPHLRAAITLTNSGAALHYPLDITLSQPSRLVYIAPPELEGIDDPHEHDRIQLIEQSNPFIEIDESLVPSKQALTKQHDQILASLRKDAGLAVLDTATRYRKGYDGERYEICANPGEVRITGVKEARGFTYLNLNDGDSWGYFHPTDKPDILYNFKMEKCLLIQEINPEYHRQAKRRAAEVKQQQRIEERRAMLEEQQEEALTMLSPLEKPMSPDDPPVHFYCIDDEYGGYRVGTYDPAHGVLDLRERRGASQLDHFATQFALPPPNYIPSCKIIFDPCDMTLYQPPANGRLGKINLYCPSPYRRNIVTDENWEGVLPPTTIHALMTHVMGGDEEFVFHFYNWLAYIFQTGGKTQTAWLMSGTTGTGKDTLAEHVLFPLLGQQQCIYKRLDQLEEAFDGELRSKQLLIANEASTAATKNADKIFDKLNEMITGTHLGLREMYKQHAMYRSFLNIVAFTNHYNAIRMDENDRRWNVPPRQEHNLATVMSVGTDLHLQLKAELQEFANYLWNFKVDENAVKVPRGSSAKEALQFATTDLPRMITTQLKAGNLAFFVDMLPPPPMSNIRQAMIDVPSLPPIIKILDRIVEDIHNKRVSKLTRADIATFYWFAMGDRWDYTRAMGKFNKLANHYGWNFNILEKSRVDVDGIEDASVPGTEIQFTATSETLRTYNKLYRTVKVPLAVVK